jgi:hypothetical protein
MPPLPRPLPVLALVSALPRPVLVLALVRPRPVLAPALPPLQRAAGAL